VERIDKRIGFIGAGNMGEAIISGLIKSNLCKAGQIWASDVRGARLSELKKLYKINTAENNAGLFDAVDIVVLSVKPQQMKEVLDGLSRVVVHKIETPTLLISIAAGFPIRMIEKHLYNRLDENSRRLLPIVRVMPNTPALVLAGMAGMSGNRYVRESDLSAARMILGAIGKVIEFKEKELDAVTALSGSGPAYVFYFVEALIEAGTRLGLKKSDALTLILETIKGSVKLLEETGETPLSLRKKVTSKGGTTEAALGVLKKHSVKDLLIKAIIAAAQRSRQLSESG